MASSYPNALDAFTNPQPHDRQGDEVGGRTHSEMHGDANDAIEAIQAELGTNPSGDYATVKDRLDDPHVTADRVDFNLTAAELSAVGRLAWDDADGTLSLGLKGGAVTLQVGQESLLRIVNKTGSALSDGQVVYVNGAQGFRPKVGLASASTEVTSSKTIGVVTEPIANNAEGFVTLGGLVRGIDTSAFADGDALWLSTTAGAMTTTRPAAPNHGVLIGWCIRSHAQQGVVLVHVANGWELEELHDVAITAAADGDVLTFDATSGVWRNQQPAAVASTSYVHTQNTPATVWTVNHGLGFYPQATVLEFGGANVEGEIEYQSGNQLTLTFSVSIAGTAYIS